MTYHRLVSKPDDVVNTIPHEVLSELLRGYIESHNVKQDKYFFEDNGFYFFIYLDNGDRIDYSL